MAEDVIRNDPDSPVVRPGLTAIAQRVSWGAVWAGVMAALGMEVLFAMFGLFIGFGMYHWQAARPWGGISAWSTIWFLVTAGWSMFFGAWCAAKLSGNPLSGDRILHGISTWGLATVVTITIVGFASWAVLRDGIDVLSTAAIAAERVVPAAAQNLPAAEVTHAANEAARVTTQLQANAGPVGQATADILSRFSLTIWIGVLVGFITAILGGLAGRSRSIVLAAPEIIPGPTRRAA